MMHVWLEEYTRGRGCVADEREDASGTQSGFRRL